MDILPDVVKAFHRGERKPKKQSIIEEKDYRQMDLNGESII